MKNKKWVIDIARQSDSMSEIRDSLLNAMRELSLVYEATHYCITQDELISFMDEI